MSVPEEDGFDLPAIKPKLLASPSNRQQFLVHVERVFRLHVRRFAIPVEEERIVGAVDVDAVPKLPAAAHVEHRIVAAVKDAMRAKTLQSQTMHIWIRARPKLSKNRPASSAKCGNASRA